MRPRNPKNERLTAAMSRYQVVQADLNLIRIRLYSQQILSPDYLREMSREAEQLNPGLRCFVEVAKRIEAGPSGKFQRYITRVPTASSENDSILNEQPPH